MIPEIFAPLKLALTLIQTRHHLIGPEVCLRKWRPYSLRGVGEGAFKPASSPRDSPDLPPPREELYRWPSSPWNLFGFFPLSSKAPKVFLTLRGGGLSGQAGWTETAASGPLCKPKNCTAMKQSALVSRRYMSLTTPSVSTLAPGLFWLF